MRNVVWMVVGLLWCAWFPAHSQQYTNASGGQIQVFPKNQPIRLPAPTGITSKALGDGFDFQLLRAGKVFSCSVDTVNTSEYAAVDHNIENEFELNAHGQFLFIKAGVSVKQDRRYSVLRVYEIVRTEQMDVPYDATYSGKAKFFISKIHYGHSFEVVLEGDYSSLHGRLGATLIKATGDISAKVQEAKCSTKTNARGLTPRNPKALWIAKDGFDFEQNFVKTAPTPIFIELNPLEDFTSKSIPFSSPTITPGIWTLAKIEFQISGKKQNGHNWDMMILGDKNAPDPSFEILYGKANSLTRAGATKTYKDQTQGYVVEKFMVNLQPGEYVQIKANDIDFGSGNDYIGFVAIPTDEIFKKLPGEPIVCTIKDDSGGFSSATLYFTK